MTKHHRAKLKARIEGAWIMFAVCFLVAAAFVVVHMAQSHDVAPVAVAAEIPPATSDQLDAMQKDVDRQLADLDMDVKAALSHVQQTSMSDAGVLSRLESIQSCLAAMNTRVHVPKRVKYPVAIVSAKCKGMN